ncbi:membrane protein [Saccharothrix mutabilis subsp. mutabilis]|uniref:Membrane protein n=1 Tax=Saccharothrix mutabilis subsp. mutabilis TaxID=66855 RepID=A0ABN0UM96_9PSEU
MAEQTWPSRPRASAWTGWIGFAAIMMIVIGAFNVIEGVVALFDDEYYVVGPDNVLVLDLTGWGWTHLVIGVLIALAGAALLTGAAWARVVAVVFAALNAVVQLGFVSVQPVWSTIVIALCVVVVWAVVVHGDEVGGAR